MPTTFALVRRGYDRAQVDAYIGQQEKARQGDAATYKEKIQHLEADKRDLCRTLDEYRAKQQAIAEALTQAQQVLLEAKQQADRLARLEQDRLRRFCDQWTQYARNALAETEPTLCAALETMRQEYAAAVTQSLAQDLFCAQDAMYATYRAEQDRVQEARALHLEDLLDKLKRED